MYCCEFGRELCAANKRFGRQLRTVFKQTYFAKIRHTSTQTRIRAAVEQAHHTVKFNVSPDCVSSSKLENQPQRSQRPFSHPLS